MAAATISGQVTDPQGGAVLGAKVSLYSTGASQARRVATDAAGAFRFAGIADGAYLLEVEADGFRLFTKALTLAGETKNDVRLEVGGVSNYVQVTAEAAALTIDQTAKAVTVIEGAEIRARDEYSLFEILRTAPGVQVRNQGGPGQFTQLRIRGLRPEAAQVLVDGMRLRDASTLQGDFTPMAPSLNFINLDRVEVMRGSGGSLFGTQSVGGSINLVTEQGGGPVHGDVLMEGGGLGYMRGRATLGGGALANRLVYSGGFSHVNVLAGVDGNDRNRSTGGQGFVRYDLTPRIHLSNRYFASDDFAQNNTSAATTGIPAANIPNTTIVRAVMLPQDQVRVLNAGGRPDYGNATLVPARDDPDNRRGGTFHSNLVSVRGDLNAHAGWQANWQSLRTERLFANGPAGFGFQPVGFATVTAPRGAIDTVDARVNTGVRRYRLTLGYEFEREAFRDRQDNNQPGNSRLIVNSQFTQHSNAAYMQHQLSLLDDRLQLSASGRWQAFSLQTPAFDMRGVRNPYLGLQTVSPPRALTGDASAAYFVRSTGTKLRAHVGNSYRAPSLYERFGGGFFANPATGDASFTPYGDPRLGPDRYNSYDYGVDQYLFRERVRLSATHFYVRTKQLIIFDFSGLIRAATDPFGRSSGYAMGPGGINRGVELAVEARPGRSTVVSGSYTYVNANTDRDSVITGFFHALNVPRHTASFVVTQRLGPRFDVTFDLFRSGVHYINYFAGTRSRAYEFPAYTKADLVASYKLWTADRRSARVFFKADNVLNRTYYENGTLNPRLWAIAGVAVSF